METKLSSISKTTALLLLLGVVACSAPKPSAAANITNLQTETLLGVAKFTETKKGVILNVELQAEKNVTLAVHIHQYGNCSDADGKSAGGHWNPTEENHGAWGDGSFHSGDLGNVTTDKNGKGSLEVLDVFGRWSLDEDKITTVLNKAISVHAGMDDMTSQPSGAAGKRIGCGEIKKIK